VFGLDVEVVNSSLGAEGDSAAELQPIIRTADYEQEQEIVRSSWWCSRLIRAGLITTTLAFFPFGIMGYIALAIMMPKDQVVSEKRIKRTIRVNPEDTGSVGVE
jgi:hypothetical protein